ncbi:MAG: 16S rRNA (cytidine(1402)-2'-O)-methyltransferase [Clostridiales bacterium]|jgi:16S rRNA (cytidine1402-2'-O)-methyltransferase|nr:16S rRNA (cytidine(1402)-2'-O)-methyltransferase [Clostridiales bacterium]
MNGVFTICGTPIGNLEDMSPRALKALAEADIVAAEDTRRTLRLLNHFNIAVRLESCHEHNEARKSDALLKRLLSGQNVTFVSDAGMPCVSDPGGFLANACHENGIRVTAAPGPTALTTAIALSGFDCGRFIFEGFLTLNDKERAKTLDELKNQRRAVVFYEAPHRLLRTLKDISDHFGDRMICVAREITKIHEEVLRLPAKEAVAHYERNDPRGEYVIVVKGLSASEFKKAEISRWEGVSVERHVDMYAEKGMDRKEAVKAAARDRGVSKSEVYNIMMKKRRP